MQPGLFPVDIPSALVTRSEASALKRSTNNVAGQILHGFFLSGQNARSDVHVEPGVPPFIQQRNHIRHDLALCQKHLEHIMSEYLLYSSGINFRRDGKYSVFMKTAIGYQDMQVGMKPKHIPEGLYGDNPSGDRLWVTRTSFVIDIETAMTNCFDYLKDFIPLTLMALALYEPDLSLARIIATIEYGKVKHGPRILHMPEKLNQKYRRSWTKLGHSLLSRFQDLDRVSQDGLVLALQRPLSSEMMQTSVIRLFLDLDGKRLGGLLLWEEGRNRHSNEHLSLLRLLNDPLAVALSNALRYEEVVRLKDMLADDNVYLSRELFRLTGEKIIGVEGGLRHVMDRVRRVSVLDTPALLLGETGVGKEIIANAIHHYSPRKNGPFIRVNCGAIPYTLMDSGLFGHEKGAFTGAVAQKRGLFERAHNGTIFLDEIGELDASAQVKLLRVLDQKEIERVGGTQYIPTNIRLIAATHRNLQDMVAKNQFREDLFFRLNVFPITIPPLKHRKTDIPDFVLHFVDEKSRELKITSRPAFGPGVMNRLVSYDWPGNVRELVNAVERELILRKEEDDHFILRFEELGLPEKKQSFHGSFQTQDEFLPLEAHTKIHIERALERAKGKISGSGGAAEILNINPGTLRAKMRKLDILHGQKYKFSH
jgi:transcriptional regulator with GAF, ATPase, and Fis domain